MEPSSTVLRRYRTVGALLATVLGVGALWTLATPGPLDRFGTLKGSDFAQFYVAARLAAAGLTQLYNWPVFAQTLAASVPGPTGLLYLSVYPPQLALLLQPLALLGYLPALAWWTLLSCLAYAIGSALVVRSIPALARDRLSAWVFVLAYPPFQQVLLNGQVATLATLVLAAAWMMWKDGRRFLAGAALGCLAFKPTLLTVTVAACVLVPSVPLWTGVATSVAGQVLAVTAVGGFAIWPEYIAAARRVLADPGAFEPKVGQMQSLNGFFTLLVGRGLVASMLYLAASVAVLFLARRVVRQAPGRAISYSAVVVAGLLLDPHLYGYDLVVLTIPLALIVGWLSDRQGAPRGLVESAWLLYLAPLAVPVFVPIRIQVSTIAMAWFLWQLATVVAAPGPSISVPGTASPSRAASAH